MTKKHSCIVIYTTFQDLNTAKRIITGLVHNKLAACGNTFRLHSIYRWKGKLERKTEYGAFIKTRKTYYKKVERYIKKHHPYEVPEIISWMVEKGSPQYLWWIAGTTANRKPQVVSRRKY